MPGCHAALVAQLRRRYHPAVFPAWKIVPIGMLLLTGCSGTKPPPVTPAKAQDVLRAVREPGAKAVLVNMWATWCVPCRDTFEAMQQRAKDRGF